MWNSACNIPFYARTVSVVRSVAFHTVTCSVLLSLPCLGDDDLDKTTETGAIFSGTDSELTAADLTPASKRQRVNPQTDGENKDTASAATIPAQMHHVVCGRSSGAFYILSLTLSSSLS